MAHRHVDRKPAPWGLAGRWASTACQAMAWCALLALPMAGCGGGRTTAGADFPAGDAPNAHGLVSAGWLKQLLDYDEAGGKRTRPATYRADRFVILEASWTEPDQPAPYLSGHIPRAVLLSTDDLETGYPQWRLRPSDELRSAIGRAGVTGDTTVIVYAHKAITAARAWWVLKYAGVADVRILDGGWEAWKSAGYAVETQASAPAPAEFSAPTNDKLLATTDYVRQRLQSDDAWLADVRSDAEFAGRISGYRYLDAKGRIPGALHLGDADDAARLYCRRDGRLRPPSEILDHWRQCGLAADAGAGFEREVIFYCGGGWRSSLACYYAWLLGLENVRNYSDGWGGWSTVYERDPSAQGGTPLWRQRSTGNPVESDPL